MSEGAALRDAGVEKDILVLGGVPERLLAPVVELDLTLPVWRLGVLPQLARLGQNLGRPVKVQVKVETGLNDDYNVEIKSGLNGDEEVFVNYLVESAYG